jgi:hypothetical protein
MRHQIADGDIGKILARAVAVLHAQVRKRKFAETSTGRRCEAREFLEFDHVEPWAHTRTHSVEGITLRCRAHNQLRARNDFGDRHMARFQRSRSQPQLDSNPVV